MMLLNLLNVYFYSKFLISLTTTRTIAMTTSENPFFKSNNTVNENYSHGNSNFDNKTKKRCQ